MNPLEWQLPEWKLPDEGQAVLVYIGDGDMDQTDSYDVVTYDRSSRDDKCHWIIKGAVMLPDCYVKAWMPLPDAPVMAEPSEDE